MRNIVYVYFFYGLAFFALGLVVLLESGRTSEFRFARALVPLALFGLVHGAHEWFEMFQIFAAHETQNPAGDCREDLFRIVTLVLSFLLLLDFGARLLPGAEDHPRAHLWQVAAMGALWLAAVGFIAWRNQPSFAELLSAADVLARYSLAIPGALLAAWALLRERRDFHARDVGLRTGSAVGRVGFLHLRPGADLHTAQPRLPFADDQHGVLPAHVRHSGSASARAGGRRHRHHPGPRAAGVRAGGPDSTGARQQGAHRGAGRHPGGPAAPRQRGGGAQYPVGGRRARTFGAGRNVTDSDFDDGSPAPAGQCALPDRPQLRAGQLQHHFLEARPTVGWSWPANIAGSKRRCRTIRRRSPRWPRML